MAWQMLLKKMRKLDKEGSSSSLSDEAEMHVDHAVHKKKPAKPQVETQSVCAAVPLRKPRKVSFKDVETRHYKLILGDNPFTEVPLGLGWEYGEESDCCTVDEHEERNQSNGAYVHAQYMEPMDVSSRQARLRSVGYSREQIRKEERMRRITVLQEWAYRCNREDSVICTVPNGAAMFKHYIL